MKPLLQLNIFISKLEHYYQTNNGSSMVRRIDNILIFKKKFANIAMYPTQLHPEKITELRGELLSLLPYRTNPVYNIYLDELTEILNNCSHNSKLKTA